MESDKIMDINSNQKGFFGKLTTFIISLKTKLIISFLVITVMPLLHTSWVTMKNATNGLQSVIVSNSIAHAKKSTRDIQNFLNIQIKMLEKLSKNFFFETASKKSILQQLINMDSNNYQIENIFIHKSNGELILSADKLKNIAINFKNIDMKLQNTLSNSYGKTFLSSSLFNDQEGNPKISLTISIDKNLIKNHFFEKLNENLFISVIINSIEVSSLLSENTVGETTKSFLINEKNEIISSFPENHSINLYESTILSALLKKKEYGVFSAEKGNLSNSYMIISVPVSGFQWKIVLLQNQKEVYSLVMLFKKDLMWILILTTMAAIFIALIISQNIAVPIIEVTKIANDFAAGKLDARINLNRRDEAGQLASSFNIMAGSLKKKIMELESAYESLKNHAKIIENTNVELDRKIFEVTTLYEVSKNIGQADSNLDKIENIVLEKCLQAVKARRISLMMLNDTDKLELKKVREWNELTNQAIPVDFTTRVNLNSGSGIAGNVVKTGQVYVSNNVKEDKNFLAYKKNNITPPSNLMCIPLEVKNNVIGVINLSNTIKDKPFSDKDIDFMKTLTSQAAMAIDNTRLFTLAITDGLTGLYMVRHFKNRMEEEIKRARRYSGIFSILFMDIDHFKIFNDTYGHQQGDIVLKGFADIMRECVRTDIDIPARYGGEEFIILLPETDCKGALKCAERLRLMIEEHNFPGQEEALHVTTSIGISEYPKHSEKLMDLIKQSDTALYYAKEHGRNTVTIYDSSMEIKSEK